MTRNQRIILIFATVIVMLGILAAVEHFGHKGAGNQISQPPVLIPVSEGPFTGPYSMTDHNGTPVTEKSWPGKYKLIYFGFTYCPAICPTELQKITAALTALGEQAAIIQPLFFTVDPERDTAKKMKDYVSVFYPSLIGVRGNAEQTAATLKEFKIYAAKVQEEGMNDYTMDHSSFIYFMAPDGRLLHIFKMEDNAETMRQVISQWLEQEQLQ